MRALVLASALLLAAPAFATSNGSSATLADSASAPAGRTIIDGAAWSCEGATCTATGGASQPAVRACRRVAARLGQVTAFTWKGQALTTEQISTCNA